MHFTIVSTAYSVLQCIVFTGKSDSPMNQFGKIHQNPSRGSNFSCIQIDF